MTVNVQTPRISFNAYGEQLLFAFPFGIVESLDLVVEVDGIIQIEYSDYTVQPTQGQVEEDWFQYGGEVLFAIAPTGTVLIRRNTTISQQVDYPSFQAFPAETHEWNLDKITYILQEFLQGALGEGVTFDLSVTTAEETVTINNTGGTDATIPSWVSATTAGVFHGEITEDAPDEGDPTSKPDGYIYLEVAP